MNPELTPNISQHVAIASILEAGASVSSTYEHASKIVQIGDPIVLPAALLKWYEIHPLDRPVPQNISALARRAFDQAGLNLSGFGFVLLHRCGESFYFLIASTWQNENELWESVWYKNDDSMSEFAEFPRPSGHVPTFCVWELAPVYHEKQTWVRFLLGNRSEQSAKQWLHDIYQGSA